MKPQRGEDKNPWYGEKSKKKKIFLKKAFKELRGHSQTSLLWACQIQ
jgi:hypothetical protein